MDAESTLYIVPTPIGNLADMVPRAVDILKAVDFIAAEDTRHSRPLLDHFVIRTPVIAYHEHSSEQDTQNIIRRLIAGESAALISDAGTPLVSDPGYRLVDAALAAGIPVVPIPGPVAAMVALSASGLPSDRFVFEGFLPAKSGTRCNHLQALQRETRTMIFYEAPHRLQESLSDMAKLFGEDRLAVLARELTKKFETIRRLPLAELRDWVASDANQRRGECVVLVSGCEARVSELSEEVSDMLAVLVAELPLKQAAALASRITGIKKNLLYQYALEHLQE